MSAQTVLPTIGSNNDQRSRFVLTELTIVTRARNVEIHGSQTTCNHLLQSCNADPEEVKKKDEISSLQQSLENPGQEAQKAHSYYVEVTKRCKTEWAELTELEAKSTLNDNEKEKLAVLKNGFNLVISADYQMAKLVPYWG